MSDVCKGGCGTPIGSKNRSGFAWGHAKGCPTNPPPPGNPEAITEVEGVEEEIPHVEISLNAAQLSRIWEALSLTDKAYAIACALEQLAG